MNVNARGESVTASYAVTVLCDHYNIPTTGHGGWATCRPQYSSLSNTDLMYYENFSVSYMEGHKSRTEDLQQLPYIDMSVVNQYLLLGRWQLEACSQYTPAPVYVDIRRRIRGCIWRQATYTALLTTRSLRVQHSVLCTQAACLCSALWRKTLSGCMLSLTMHLGTRVMDLVHV